MLGFQSRQSMSVPGTRLRTCGVAPIRSQRIVDAARADEQDTSDQLKSAQKSAKHEHERAQNLTQRVDELREALDFHVRTENAVADARDQLNSSLSKAQQQVSLLQRRGLELEDVGAREASSRRETQARPSAATAETPSTA